MVRILQVVEPGRDGVFRHVENLVQHALMKGHHVDLAFSSRRGSERLWSLVQQVSDAGGESLDLSVSNAPSARDAKSSLELRKLIQRCSPEVIHSHSSKAGAIARALCLLNRIPSVYTPNGYYGLANRRTLQEHFFNFVELSLGRIGTTINVSHDEATFARTHLRIPAKKQKVIYNGIDTSKFTAATTILKKSIRHEIGLPENAFVVGTVGRLSFQKDPITLLRAISVARKNHSVPAFLLHLGQGELDSSYQTSIQELELDDCVKRVHYLPEPSRFYHGLDAFVLTSRYEGLAYSVIEALSSNLPIILSDVPGNREFSRVGLSHLRFAPPGDADAFALQISAQYEASLSPMEVNHRAVAIEKFDLTPTCDQIFALYDRIRRPAASKALP